MHYEVQNLDLDKETFEVGKCYKEPIIIEMARRNGVKINNHSDPACSINYSIKKFKTALHIEFYKDLNLWFIFVGYHSGERIYKCVFFEN